MEDLKKLVEGLHPLERKILPFLDRFDNLKDLSNESKMQEVQVMRALQWFSNKYILKIVSSEKEVVVLDKNGLEYKKNGLPEKRLLLALKKTDLSFVDAQKNANLSKEEIGVCLGVLRKKAAIVISPEKKIKLIEPGKKLLENESLEEKFLNSEFPIEFDKLKDEQKFALESLKKRKDIIKIELEKTKKITLTELGKKLIKEKIDDNVSDRLTSDMLKKSTWQNKKFRRYDVKINVPKIFGGKKQHYRRFLDEVRGKFLALGFSEMPGRIVESEFFNMDALFMPQDHSARDIHGAYYIKEPKSDNVQDSLIKKVKDSHEKGTGTISKGWGYKFDLEKTKQFVLRTQGTACSARMLASKDLKIPGKYFAIARCFRPDVIDATHNVDFNQTEGIVIEEGLDFRYLKGLLKMFAEEFAQTDQIRIKPGYFPFTEPSAELMAKHPDLGWIELGGSGIFRPELVKPLVGREIPVLAWGIGIDRIAMFNLGIDDIRKLFSHDLEFLRNIKVI